MSFILETERLYLRHFEADDAAALHEIFSDAETMRFYPAPFTIEQTHTWISRNQNRYKADGFGLWAVCLKDTDEVIGDCGLITQIINGEAEVEIGYHIHKRYWSKGFAAEAALKCKEYGFQQLKKNKLVSIIAPNNIQSIKVAEKIGFTFEREEHIFNKKHYIYSGTRASFELAPA